ncbi:hypothetical protein DFS33DRAFT_273652 [Desarmillaria ectypa]|nr:hypothetical protein DFS33DRAFT_273652 [Desarmillaria ectypa]
MVADTNCAFLSAGYSRLLNAPDHLTLVARRVTSCGRQGNINRKSIHFLGQPFLDAPHHPHPFLHSVTPLSAIKMTGTKRASDDTTGPTTRASKAAKTDNGTHATATKGAKKGGKRGAKASLPASTFKNKALPLHINVTHTPPSIDDDELAPAASADPGFLATLALLPTSFATGSYGWKGTKRFSVELPNPDGGDENEKVQVMLTVNAAVVGSKQAPGEDGETKEDHAKEDDAKAEEENKEEHPKEEASKDDEKEEAKPEEEAKNGTAEVEANAEA